MSSLQNLCEVAKKCSYTRVIDFEHQQIIHMDLSKCKKTILKGGTVRAIFEVSPYIHVKAYVFSCKRNKLTVPCNACLNKSHHKCVKPVYLHVVIRKN